MPSILKLPGTRISGVPVPPVDPRLTNGSLLLLDPTHPADPFTGSAVAGATIPNIAKEQALTLVGQPVQSATIFDTTTAPGRAEVRKTSKGSLHFTSSVTNDVANERVGLQMPQSLRDYLLANTSHQYYLGVSATITRPTAYDGSVISSYAGIFRSTDFAGAVALAVATMADGAAAGSPGSTSPNRLGFSAVATGNILLTTIGTTQLGLSAVQTSYIAATGPWAGTNALHRTPSFVLRSFYLEDLTVSGRTHAQVTALDQAANESGTYGRWAGDTYTGPLS